MQDLINFFSHNIVLCLSWLVVLALLLWTELRNEVAGVKKLSPQELVQLMNSEHALVLDIRDEKAFQNAHVLNAKSVKPEDILAKDSKYKRLKGKRTIILIGNSDNDSIQLAKKLKNHGFEKIHILKNGMNAWVQAGMPVTKDNEIEPAKISKKSSS